MLRGSVLLGTDWTGNAAIAVQNSVCVFVTSGSNNVIGTTSGSPNRIGFGLNYGVYLRGSNNDGFMFNTPVDL